LCQIIYDTFFLTQICASSLSLNMHQLQLIRLELGISQRTLADMLGLTRSHITMAEQGKRKLPSEAVLILKKLCDNRELPLMEENPEALPEVSAGFAEFSGLREQLTAAIAKYEKQIARLVFKRDKCLAARTAAQKSSRMMEQEMLIFGKVPAYVSKMQPHQEAIQDTLRKTDPATLALLDWKINELNAMIHIAQQELQRHQPPTQNEAL